ncbi:serine protease snk-like isoform X2 [Haematobia irritans]|uniref:serine protease snk-like isoform X2 n=1 Tax=Haematobia irritans TaxID=7368 RepID=UPI003F4F8849
MELLTHILVVLCILTEYGCGVPKFEIIRGINTVYKEFPYMVALGWDSMLSKNSYDYKCGGVLIAPNFVLTAAHCTHLNGLPPSVALVGGTNLSDTSSRPLNIIDVINHPQYKPNLSYNDIALIKLANSSESEPICVWSLYPMDDVNVTAIGYGHTQFAGISSETLLKTYLSIIPNSDCSHHFPNEQSLPSSIVETQLCAKDFQRQSDTCQGDSGGPLILRSTSQHGVEVPFVVGITSFGRICGMNQPGVYTRVSEYIDWIESILFK